MHGLIISYKAFFDHEEPDLNKIMASVPSRVAIDYFCYICCQLHKGSVDAEVQEKLLDGLIKNQPQRIQQTIWAKYNECKQKESTIIFDIYTALQLLNAAILNFNHETPIDSTPQDELNILICTLLVNERYNKMPPKKLDGSKLDLFSSMVWPIHIFSTELRLTKNFRYEFYRGLMFSEFIGDYPELIQAMKELYGVNEDALHNYPLEVFNFYGKNGLDKENQIFNSSFSLDLESAAPMFKSWILDLSTIEAGSYIPTDYRTLRSKPIIKLAMNKYVISNWNFILDKLYTGLLFDLISTDVVKAKYCDLRTLKGKVGETFSEYFAFHMLKATSPDMVLVQGNPNDEANHDFYIRQGKKIALIENKDALFIKNADYSSIIKELHSKLVSPNGVNQLIKIFKKLKANPYLIEYNLKEEYKSSELIFYPLLLVSDSTFVLTGMEDYVQREFNLEIQKLGDLPFKVNPIIILDIHTLINLHDTLALNETDIFSLADEFFKKKVVLKLKGNQHGAKVSSISAQFQGFVELMGSRGSIKDGDIEGSLLYKTMKRMKELGVPE